LAASFTWDSSTCATDSSNSKNFAKRTRKRTKRRRPNQKREDRALDPENVGGGAEAGVEIAKTATGDAVAAAAEVASAIDTDDATD